MSTRRGRPPLPRWPEIPKRYRKPQRLTGTERELYDGYLAYRRQREEELTEKTLAFSEQMESPGGHRGSPTQ